MAGRKILILGSEGFIGSYAVRYFLLKGFEVFKADILLKKEPNYFLINPEASDFRSIFLKEKFDFCLNATGAANVQLSFEYPDLDFTLNTANVFNILNCIREFNSHCKFINLSSAAVYGNPNKLPVKEDSNISPLSPYGYHKYYSELISEEFYSLFGIQTLSVRVFSAYGPGLRKQLFWDLYVKSKNKSKSILSVFGTGLESRDFIFIEDILVALELLFLNLDFKGQKINIGTGIEIKIEEAVNTFFQLLNPTIQYEFSGMAKEGNPLNWEAEISTLKNLGFIPKYSLFSGLEETVKWLKGLD